MHVLFGQSHELGIKVETPLLNRLMETVGVEVLKDVAMELFLQEVAALRPSVTVIDRKQVDVNQSLLDEVFEPLLSIKQDANSVFVVVSDDSLMCVN